jgi:hypothetical protein
MDPHSLCNPRATALPGKIFAYQYDEAGTQRPPEGVRQRLLARAGKNCRAGAIGGR